MKTLRRLLLALLPPKRIEITPEPEPGYSTNLIQDPHTGEHLEITITDMPDHVIISPHKPGPFPHRLIVISISELLASIETQRNTTADWQATKGWTKRQPFDGGIADRASNAEFVQQTKGQATP